MRKIKAELNNLAAMTADEIAEYLAAKNVKGSVAGAARCPLAEHLKQTAGGKTKVSVNTESILVWWIYSKTFKVPNIVKLFIFRFDQGKYPELQND